jgi:hypothetical protein
MVGTKTQSARTQSLMRDVNERLREINDGFGPTQPYGDWLCECADETCIQPIALTPGEYDAVRAHPKRFAVAAAQHHVLAEVEFVVERNDRYWVVEKDGLAGELVARIDPRRTGDRTVTVGFK